MKYNVILGRLVAKTALHVGEGGGHDITDAPVQRDAQGRPVIPGTAIAGALRGLLNRLVPDFGGAVCRSLAEERDERSLPCACPVCRLFGDINPSDAEGSLSAASRLYAYNAQVTGGDMPMVAVRDGVGIGRASGAAAAATGAKFDFEVIPAGTVFEMRLELRDAGEDDERWLAAALAEWREGRLWIGGRSARGLGAVILQKVEFRTLTLSNPKDLIKYLRSDEPWTEATAVPNWMERRVGELRSAGGIRSAGGGRGERCGFWPSTWVTFTGILRFEGGCVTHDTVNAAMSGFHHAPTLERTSAWERPVLPGAAVRGVLRSHAERLARTLAYHWAGGMRADNGRSEFLARCPACDPLAKSTGRMGPLHLESCDSLLNKSGAPEEAAPDDTLCLSCRLFGSSRLGSRLRVEDAPLDEQCTPRYKMWDFLAVDRLTGGAAKGRKFDALVLWRPAFRLRIHLESPRDWELGWLALVLRDMAAGWLQVGYGRAKGFGRMRLEKGQVTFGYLSEGDLPPEWRTAGGARGESGLYRTCTVEFSSEAWVGAAQPWVDSFRETVRKFRRTPGLILSRDDWFDCSEDMALAYFAEDGGV